MSLKLTQQKTIWIIPQLALLRVRGVRFGLFSLNKKISLEQGVYLKQVSDSNPHLRELSWQYLPLIFPTPLCSPPLPQVLSIHVLMGNAGQWHLIFLWERLSTLLSVKPDWLCALRKQSIRLLFPSVTWLKSICRNVGEAKGSSDVFNLIPLGFSLESRGHLSLVRKY